MNLADFQESILEQGQLHSYSTCRFQGNLTANADTTTNWPVGTLGKRLLALPLQRQIMLSDTHAQAPPWLHHMTLRLVTFHCH